MNDFDGTVWDGEGWPSSPGRTSPSVTRVGRCDTTDVSGLLVMWSENFAVGVGSAAHHR